jgi:hypothetical protein
LELRSGFHGATPKAVSRIRRHTHLLKSPGKTWVSDGDAST